MVDISKMAYSHSSLKDFDNCPLAFYKKRVTKEFRDPPNAYSTYGETVHKALELRVKNKVSLPEALARYESLLSRFDGMECAAELELAVNRNLQRVGWFDDDVFFRAKLDLVVWPSPDSAWVCDYKTGKRRMEVDQLEISAWMLFRLYPKVQNIKASFLWLKEDKLDTEVFSRADVPSLAVRHLGRIAQIEHAARADNWPARPSGLCAFCGWKPHCVYAKK